MGEEDEERHGENAAANPEERGEDPRREPDGDEAHGTYRTSVISRGGLIVLLAAVVLLCGAPAAVSGPPPVGSTIYVVRPDPRLCPSPLCGGYWVSVANHGRTRCTDGALRPRCYVAWAVDEDRHPYAAGIPDGALVLADIEPRAFEGFGELGVLVVEVVFAPAGRAPESGGFYRLVDTGIRCIRAPCFSLRASRLNQSTRLLVSGADIGSPRATPEEWVRAEAALGTKNGLLARGRIVATADGGRRFRATRFYLRSPG